MIGGVIHVLVLFNLCLHNYKYNSPFSNWILNIEKVSANITLIFFWFSGEVLSCFQESLKLIYISSQSEVCFTRSDWNYTNLLSAVPVPVLLWLVFIQITPDIGLFFSLMRFVLEKLMHYHYYFSALPAIWLENCNCKLSLVEFNISKNKIVRNTQQKF